MINILFIIYEFPPLNSGGSHRPYRFSKYLKEFNITATVITPKVAKKEIDSSWSKELEDIKWQEVFSKYRIEFEKQKSFETHIKGVKKTLKDAKLCSDGSLLIDEERIYSLR